MQYTIEQAKAHAVSKGIEWTPELETTLRAQGKLIDAPPMTQSPFRTEELEMPDRGSVLGRMPERPLSASGETNIDLDDPSSLGFNVLRGMGQNTPGGIDIAPDENPQSDLAVGANMFGRGVGMLGTFATSAPVFAPLGAGLGASGGVAQQIAGRMVGGALRGGAQFGAYEATMPADSWDERLENAQHGAKIGGIFGLGANIPGVGAVLSNPKLAPAVNSALMTGLMKAQDQDLSWKDAAVRGVPFGIGLSGMTIAEGAFGRSGRPAPAKPSGETLPEAAPPLTNFGGKFKEALSEPRLQKTPAELEVPKTDLGKLRLAANEPLPGSKDSVILSRHRDVKTGNYDIDGVIKEFEAGNQSGVLPKARSTEIAKQVKAEIKDGTLKLKEGEGEGREIRRRELREMYPDIAEFLDGGGGKLTKGEVTAAPWASPMMLFQRAGGGKVGYENVLDRLLYRTNQEYQDFTLNAYDQFETEAARILDGLGVKAGTDKALELTTALKEVGPMPEWAAPMRDNYDALHDKLDRFNRATGGNGMGYLAEEGYAGPEFEAAPANFKERLKVAHDGGPRENADIKVNYKAGKSDAPYMNPSRRHRSGSVKNPEMDAVKRLTRYNSHAARDLGHNMAIRYNNDLAELASLEGNNGLATLIKNYNDSTYNNARYGPFKWAQDQTASGKAAVVNEVQTAFRGRLNKAVFAYNLAWNLTTQISSSAMTSMNSGMANASKGLFLARRPEFRALVDAVVPQQKIKNRPQTGYRRADLSGTPVGGSELVPRGIGQQFVDFGMDVGAAVERNLGYLSAAARYYEGRELGLEGRERINHMSDGIHQDQSVYDQYTRSDALKSQPFNNNFPFKSFSFTLVENLLQNFGRLVGVKHGTYMKFEQLNEVKQMRKMLSDGESMDAIREHIESGGKSKITPAQRTMMNRMIEFAVAVLVFNSWSELVKGRPVLGPSGIPGFDEITGSGMSKGRGFTGAQRVSTAAGLTKAVRGAVSGKPWQTASGMMKPASPLIGGGIGLRRIVDTMANREGADPYKIEDGWETFYAMFAGPSATKTGREYYNEKSMAPWKAATSFMSGPSIQRLMRLVDSIADSEDGGDSAKTKPYRGNRK